MAATLITASWHIAGHQESLLSSLVLPTSAAEAIAAGWSPWSSPCKTSAWRSAPLAAIGLRR